MYFKKPKNIDFSKFKRLKNPKIKFGLNKTSEFCSKCVISNQRPASAIEFKQNQKTKKKPKNKNSICDPCNYHE